MSKRTPPPWQFPSIVAGIVVALGAIGTFIVRSASYIQLPEKVAAAEEKNAKQDQEIGDLKGWAKEIQGYTRAMQQQAPNQAVPRLRDWQDPETGIWWCCDPRTDCEQDGNWWRCDE